MTLAHFKHPRKPQASSAGPWVAQPPAKHRKFFAALDRAKEKVNYTEVIYKDGAIRYLDEPGEEPHRPIILTSSLDIGDMNVSKVDLAFDEHEDVEISDSSNNELDHEEPKVFEGSDGSDSEHESETGNGLRTPVPETQVPTRQTKHCWDMHEREALCVLLRWYEIDWEDVTKVFNQHFSTALAANREEPLPERVLHAQWLEMRATSIYGAWLDVYIRTTFADPDGAWRELKEGLESSAEIAMVVMVPRLDDPKDHVLSREIYGISRPQAMNMAALLRSKLRILAETDGYTAEFPGSPLAAGDTAGVEARDEQLPAYSTDATSQELPGLLYHVYDEGVLSLNSPMNLRAPFFCALGPHPPVTPPPTDRQVLLIHMARHLWHRNPHSPLIGLTSSLVGAVHQAREIRKNGGHAHIVVVDTATLTLGKRARGVYSTAPFVKEMKRLGALNGMEYDGAAEVLVWGQIKEDAVIKLVCFEFLSVMLWHDPLTAELLRPLTFCGVPLDVVRSKFIAEDMLIDPYEGVALARIASTFGIDVNSSHEAIEKIVYDLFQGWALRLTTPPADMVRYFVNGLVECSGLAYRAFEEEQAGQMARLETAFLVGFSRAREDLEHEALRAGLWLRARPTKGSRRLGGLRREEALAVVRRQPPNCE